MDKQIAKVEGKVKEAQSDLKGARKQTAVLKSMDKVQDRKVDKYEELRKAKHAITKKRGK